MTHTRTETMEISVLNYHYHKNEYLQIYRFMMTWQYTKVCIHVRVTDTKRRAGQKGIEWR